MCREVAGRFKREGTRVNLWLIHVDVWQKPVQYCKAIILQLKINFFFLKKNFPFSFLAASVACQILVPQPWMEIMPSGLEVQGLNHWTTREVPFQSVLSVCEDSPDWWGTLGVRRKREVGWHA